MNEAKKAEFLRVAGRLNERLHVTPLLFGSLGLEQRLQADLGADDIDVLIPERFLNEGWPQVVDLMDACGYMLYDLHEHAFEQPGFSVSFASIESLTPFAGVCTSEIPVLEEGGVCYALLELRDYLKVYTASSKDGYRKTVKNKKDEQKIARIREALDQADQGGVPTGEPENHQRRTWEA